LKTDPNY